MLANPGGGSMPSRISFVGQAALAPAWMVAASFTDARLEVGGHLVGAGVRAMGAVGEHTTITVRKRPGGSGGMVWWVECGRG
jgi:hypothetical protein